MTPISKFLKENRDPPPHTLLAFKKWESTSVGKNCSRTRGMEDKVGREGLMAKVMNRLRRKKWNQEFRIKQWLWTRREIPCV